MDIRSVLLIGGSGFVGTQLAEHLCDFGLHVTVPTRHRERAKQLLPLPTTEVIEADVHDPAELERLIRGQDAIINAVGVLHSRAGTPYGPDFARAHVELPRKIVAASRKHGIKRLLHISALKADSDGPSAYLRSKGDGEATIRQADASTDDAGSPVGWTVFQPSVIFGPKDGFLNMFADLARTFPVLPLGCPDARFQPVFVEDVAAAVVASLTDASTRGRTYELCGPKVYTLRQLVEYVGELIDCRRPIIGLSQRLSYLQARLLELAPGSLMSRDNVDSMKVDNVCSGCAQPEYVMTRRAPTALESVAPTYLGQHHPRARYSPFRSKARR